MSQCYFVFGVFLPLVVMARLFGLSIDGVCGSGCFVV
jgi:hypothetical protein